MSEIEAEKKQSFLESDIVLRKVNKENDLPYFFEHESDSEAVYMAAFTAKDPSDKDAFLAHWIKILADEKIILRTILLQEEVIGHIVSFEMFGQQEISYWLGKEYWGKGLATKALTAFLKIQKTRPLYARAAKDNIGSLRVLEKCGFKVSSEEKGFANARGKEIEEYVLTLA